MWHVEHSIFYRLGVGVGGCCNLMMGSLGFWAYAFFSFGVPTTPRLQCLGNLPTDLQQMNDRWNCMQ